MSQVKQLVSRWERAPDRRRTDHEYRVRLPLRDAARLAALREMFPGQSETDLITDLLRAALDDLEAALPYEAGGRVIGEDDYGDPIHEDVGYTPRFLSLSRRHLEELRRRKSGD